MDLARVNLEAGGSRKLRLRREELGVAGGSSGHATVRLRRVRRLACLADRSGHSARSSGRRLHTGWALASADSLAWSYQARREPPLPGQDLTRDEDEAFWTWAIVETLRHTGVRLEELLELTQFALTSYTLPDTGEVVPLLQVAPSKTDTERLLLVSPELAHVLARVVHRVRAGQSTVPLVARYDQHERLTGAPLPHLFQRRHGPELGVMSAAAVLRLLHLAIDHAGLRGPDGRPLRYTPHDFRRIFATEAASGGLPVHIAANLEDRIAEAKQRGWLGEVDGLQASLAAARHKLEQMRKLLAHPPAVPLGTQRSGGRNDRRGSERPHTAVADRQGSVLPSRGCTHPPP